MGKGKKKIAGINRKTQTVFLSWSLFKASEVKRKSLSHIFLEGSEMELFLMLILIVLVPEILGGFQAEKIVCDYQMYYSPWILTPLSSYCTLLGKNTRAVWGGQEAPILYQRTLFLMLIMWYAAFHHGCQFAIRSFAVNPVRVVVYPGRTSNFHVTACYIFICTVKMVGRYKIWVSLGSSRLSYL